MVAVDRFVASTRLAFTLCAFVAILADPSSAARNGTPALAIAIAYAFYALTTVTWAWSSAASLGGRARLGSQIIDVSTAVVLVSLSGGIHSPFFAFMVFPLLSVSLQWRQGPLWMAGASLAAYGGVASYTILASSGAPLELNVLIIQGVYIVAVTLVLALLAAHDDRIRRQMEAVAVWRRPEAEDENERLREILCHVASVVAAPRVLLLRQEADQPGPNLALWTRGHFRVMDDPPAGFEPPVAEPLRDSDFVCRDAAEPDARVLCVTPDRSWRWRGSPLGSALRSAFAIRAVIAVRLHHASLRGRLFVLDKPAATSDDLALVTVVARKVEDLLEHDHRASRLRDAALAHERARVARDVHDGALQWLAAAAFRLETIRRQLDDNPAAALDALHELQAMIIRQQRELRAYVRELQTGGCASRPGLDDLLTELVLRVEQEWHLAVKLDVKPPSERFDTAIAPELAREIHQIVREALVNAARHTLASLVCVSIGFDGDWIRITVADNGQGFPFQGRFKDAELAERNLGPVMLRQRIAALDGMLAIHSSHEGARLEIGLPRRGKIRAGDSAGTRPSCLPV